VVGKGGHERTIPLNDEVVHALRQYRLARGAARAQERFSGAVKVTRFPATLFTSVSARLGKRLHTR
jgi:site-specific recombinase XerD